MAQGTTADTSDKIDADELNRAEELLISSGKSMTHDEIRAMLQREGVSQPVVEHVVSGVIPRLVKVKSGTTISWE
jgi:DNA-binding transcriptional regulator YiaG